MSLVTDLMRLFKPNCRQLPRYWSGGRLLYDTHSTTRRVTSSCETHGEQQNSVYGRTHKLWGNIYSCCLHWIKA